MLFGGWMTGFEVIDNNEVKPYRKEKPGKKLLKRRAKNKSAHKARMRNRK